MSRTLRSGQLSSGLRLITERDPGTQTVAAGFFAARGGRHDRVPGAAHFLEHLMFKGSELLPAVELNERLDWLGGAHNAFTAPEETVYYAAALPEDLPALLDTLRELLRPALREADLEAERGVILEEIALYASQPSVRVLEAMQRQYWGAHPLDRPILGTAQSIGGVTRGELLEQLHRTYTPECLLLVVTGALDEEAVWAWAESSLAGWPQDGAPEAAVLTQQPPTQPPIQPQIQPSRRIERLCWPGLERAQAALAWPGLAAGHPLRPAAEVLAEVLGSENSRLYWALLDSGLADSADLGCLAYTDTGTFEGGFSCDPARLDEVLGRFLDVVQGAAAQPPTPGEVARAALRLATDASLGADSPHERMLTLGLENLHPETLPPGRSIACPVTPEEVVARYRAVTPEAAAAVLDLCPLAEPSGALLLPEALA